MNGSAEPVTRGVAIIVLSGALLGVGYNYLGERSRPSRGLAWISTPKQLPNFEDEYPATAGLKKQASPSGTNVETAHNDSKEISDGAQRTTAVPSTSPSTLASPATPAVIARHPRSGQPPSSASTVNSSPSSAVADPDDPLGIAVPSENAEEIPEIPDLDRPFAVQLGLVKRFFDAKAAYIVDARDVEEFDEGHIPGAVNLPFSTAGSDPARLDAIDAGERPIIIYCGGGTCEVSMSLAETLVYQHAKRKVLVYMGGFPEWQSAGFPVQKGKGDEG